MNQTIPAIYENGVIRPLQKLALDDGDEVDVIVVERSFDPERVRNIIRQIAALPEPNDSEPFSGADHDKILYPPS
jgi:predicted DNA-binding antitoxin AbrB/MazE fold protein